MSIIVADAIEAIRAQLHGDYNISTIGASIYVRPSSKLTEDQAQSIDGTPVNNRVIRFKQRKDNAAIFDLELTD